MAVRVARLQDGDACLDVQMALGKLVFTVRLREAVACRAPALRRQRMLVEYDIVRFWNDTGSLCSYEGTRESNTPIVGRAITGLQACV